MAKVTVDASTCVGCGLCEQLCPEVFKVDSEGIAQVNPVRKKSSDETRLSNGVKGSECNQQSLSEVAEQCPVDAIKIE